MSAIERAAEVLVAHQRHGPGCLCGWTTLGASHPKHQATMLAAEDLLRDEDGE